jgi:L-threonylcarbamoyladenylate synthase
VAQALLREAALPVAAPSANRSGRPSPTRVEDARADLSGSVAFYLDGGPTRVGLESTVVGLLGGRPRLLRQGGVPVEAIEAVVGPVDRAAPGGDGPALSPGTKYRHYAPRARVHLVAGGRRALEDAARGLGGKVAIVASREDAPSGENVRVPGGLREPESWARALFALLRDLDAEGYDHVVVQAIPEEGLGAAVMERLRKAAQG